MRTLIIAVIFFVFSNCFSQNKEEFSRWNLSVSGGSVYFIDKDIYWFDDGFHYLLEYPSPIYETGNWSFNHYEVTGSYFFNQNHEIGLTFGRGAFVSPYKFLILNSVSASDTIIDTKDGYRAYTSDWWGIFYNFHYMDYFYGGIKLASADYPLKSFHLGKKFNLKNSFFIKMEIGYTMLTEDSIFKFSSFESEKITLSIGLGLNL